MQSIASGIQTEGIILLHGLARTCKSMSVLEKYLKNEGFTVLNIDYPSRKKTIQELASEVIPKAYQACLGSGAGKIHFVTHSMGGILVRYFLEKNQLPRLGRVVMLSPPNNGSELVDKLKRLKLFKWWNGPAGTQLGTDAGSIPLQLGTPSFETGIITGDRSINPLLSMLIPAENDGKVSVRRAQLKGMKDFLVVHRSHSFIMNDKTVCRQVVSFIRHGEFYKR